MLVCKSYWHNVEWICQQALSRYWFCLPQGGWRMLVGIAMSGSLPVADITPSMAGCSWYKKSTIGPETQIAEVREGIATPATQENISNGKQSILWWITLPCKPELSSRVLLMLRSSTTISNSQLKKCSAGAQQADRCWMITIESH